MIRNISDQKDDSKYWAGQNIYSDILQWKWKHQTNLLYLEQLNSYNSEVYSINFLSPPKKPNEFLANPSIFFFFLIYGALSPIQRYDQPYSIFSTSNLLTKFITELLLLRHVENIACFWSFVRPLPKLQDEGNLCRPWLGVVIKLSLAIFPLTFTRSNIPERKQWDDRVRACSALRLQFGEDYYLLQAPSPKGGR